MFGFLRSRPPVTNVPAAGVRAAYYRYRRRALLGVFLAYAAFYFVRANFTLSTPYLMKAMSLTRTDIGLLSSCLLVTYGLSKGVMSSLADKCNPKYFMLFGLLLSCVVNLLLGFSSTFWAIAVLVVLNGCVQGMGAGPAFITIANWYPRRQRGEAGAVWNTSHNVGAGMVVLIATAAFSILGTQHWRAASYWAPAIAAAAVAVVVMLVGVGTPYNVGLPSKEYILANSADEELIHSRLDHAPESLSSFQIFCRYVLNNKLVWFISLVDATVYIVRFGVITWLPVYLLQSKGFSRNEMGAAFTVFEWAAIPSTLLAGFLTDKVFKGRRMPLIMACMLIIFCALCVYWKSKTIVVATAAAGVIGSLIYVPQFLASVFGMEVVPPFAVGSAVGLRGFMSYVLGSTIGTALIGVLVDSYGWRAGFYTLLASSVLCILFSYLAHRGALQLEAKRAAWRFPTSEPTF